MAYNEKQNISNQHTGTEASTLELQRLILETAEEAFCLFSAGEEKVIAYNRRFAELFDLDSSWLDEHPTVEQVASLMFQMEQPQFVDRDTYVEKVLARHHMPGEHEIESHLRDGRIFIGRTKAAVTGERLYTMHDVTAERSILRELESERQRLSSMVEHAPVAYYVIDCNSRLTVEISRSIHYLTGLTSDRFVGKCHELDDQIHPEDQQVVIKKIREAVNNRSSFDVYYRRYHLDGSIRWFRDMAEPIPVSSDNSVDDPLQMAGVIIDITRQKNAERKLRDSERRFRELIEGIADFVFYEHDSDRNLTYVSPSVRDVLGFEPEELLGHRFGELDRTEKGEGLASALQAVSTAIKTKSRQPQYEVAMRHNSGRTVTMGVVEYPVVVGGKVVGFRGVARDISNVRHMQRKLRERERLAILGTFAGGLAHDLNNLLLPIRAGLDTLERDPTPVQVQKRVDSIRLATDHIAELTTKLLMWTRNESSDASSSYITDIEQWAENALAFFRDAVREGDKPSLIRVQLHVDNPPKNAKIDPDLLKQAVLNLVLNARDSMSTGGTIQININTSPESWRQSIDDTDELFDSQEGDHPAATHDDEKEQRGVRITVTDQGCGMDESIQERAFDPFFSTKSRGKSTGLGLALVRSIIRTNGGNVHIRSRLGQGTSIILDIPGTDTVIEKSLSVNLAQTEGKALIGIADPWMAAFVNNCISKAGFVGRIEPKSLPLQGDIVWILDQNVVEPDIARKCMEDRPDLVVFGLGKPDSLIHWPDGILWVEGSLDADVIRSAIDSAITTD